MTDSAPTADVALTAKRVICLTHGEPLRAHWPTGYPAFAAQALELLLCDRDATAKTKEAAATLEAELDAQPLCCRLEPWALLNLYEEYGRMFPYLPVDRCTVCGMRAPCCDHTRTNHWGRLRPSVKVCVRCVVEKRGPRPWVQPVEPPARMDGESVLAAIAKAHPNP